MPQSYLIGLLVLAFVLAFAVVVRRIANRGLMPLAKGEVIASGGPCLVVLLHGTQGKDEYFACLRSILDEAGRKDDILPIEYPSFPLANSDPFLISEQVCHIIQSAYEAGGYSRIMLTGYSKGALIVRKAFVYGAGHIEDLTSVSGESRDPMSWVGAVERIVLIAGLNRGWNLRRRPKGMPWLRFASYRSVNQLCKLLRVATLMRKCESGEPFVANLRLQWLDLMRKLPKERRPTVIQLLGDKDDLVSSEDQRDVKVAKDFIWVTVHNTGHGNIIAVDDPTFGKERRGKIAKALGNAADVESLRRLSSKLSDDEDPLVRELVVVLHGIRDMAPWTASFELPLQEAFQAKHPGSDSKIVVRWPSYGYFGMGPFLLRPDRQKNVRWFMDEFTQFKAQYPNLEKVHFIGHSNGTYVLASALRHYRTLKVGNIVFGGSVLRRDFDWEEVSSQFDKIRNYVGARDWVVGLFPRLFEFPVFAGMNSDLGSAGFNGFTQSRGNQFETKFLDGAHSIALDERNIGSIVQFVINDRKVDEPKISSRGPTWKMEYSSKFCWAVWLLILFAALVLATGVLWLVSWLMPDLMPALQKVLAGVIFVILALAILKHV